MKRVLVTGGGGFIGRHTLAALVARGYEVHSVGKRARRDAHAGVEAHQCDVLVPGQVDDLMAELRPTHLLHLAWYTEHGVYWNDPSNADWVAASLHLVKSFVANGGRRVVAAGSCAEYDWRYGFCSESVTPLVPHTLYGRAKASLGELVMALGVRLGCEVAWGRVFFLFGPGEHPARLVSSVARALIAGEEARCSIGTQMRDFQDVRDAGGAFAALVDSSAIGAINIASGRAVAVAEVAKLIASMTTSPEKLRLGAIPLSEKEPPLIVGDVRRLTNEVGWADEHSLEGGLANAVEWWRASSTRS